MNSPLEVPVGIAILVVSLAAYLVHCQRQHVARKQAHQRKRGIGA